MAEQFQKQENIDWPDSNTPIEKKAEFFDANPDLVEMIPDEMVFEMCNNIRSYMPKGRYRPLGEDTRFADIQNKTFGEQEENPLRSEKKSNFSWKTLFEEVDRTFEELGIDKKEYEEMAEELNNEQNAER